MFGSEYESAEWAGYWYEDAAGHNDGERFPATSPGTINPADIPDGEPEEVVLGLRWVMPDGYRESIARFRDLGLNTDTMRKFIALSAGNDTVSGADKFTYFCGCCWRVARQETGQ